MNRHLVDAERAAKRWVIVEAVCRLEPHLAPDVVAAAVTAACPTTWHLSKLAGAVSADPDCLVTGRSAAAVEADRLGALLRAAGAIRVAGFVCGVCGQPGSCVRVLGGQPTCQACGAHRRDRCASCGRDRPVAVVWAAGPVCSTCSQRALAAKGTCEDCGERRRIDPRDTSGRRRCSDCAGLTPLAICAGCGGEDRIWRDRRCFACNLAGRVERLLAGPDGTVPAGLAGLAAALVDTRSPRAVLRWLDRPAVAAALAGLADGSVESTHEALDALGTDRAVAHLRQVLVAAGVLPERDETLAGLQAWVERQLTGIGNLEDRHVVAAYATWWVVRRRRARLARRPTLTVGNDHDNVRRAVELLDWLRAHQRTLTTCTQADIDLWLASGPPARRAARSFVRWARRQRLSGPIDIPRRRDPQPVPADDVAALAGLARRLIDDTSVALADRVAGLLVICYGQPAARIAALDIDRIGEHDGNTTLSLGATPIDLPEPLGRLLRELAATRRGRLALDDGTASRWLFPGARPGRPVSAARLAARLNTLGIRTRTARTTMLVELAGELPPAVIADMLGLDAGTAVRWVRAAAGDWNGYVAGRASA